MQITLRSIGRVENGAIQQTDENWGTVHSRIVLEEAYIGGLLGLDEFSHAIVVTYLHQATYDKTQHLIRRPRDVDEMPLVGIFAQRAKDRPNPIGITAVEIVRVDDDCITVLGLDAICGTPVLDVKPYFPHYDCMPKAQIPEWVYRLMKGYFC